MTDKPDFAEFPKLLKQKVDLDTQVFNFEFAMVCYIQNFLQDGVASTLDSSDDEVTDIDTEEITDTETKEIIEEMIETGELEVVEEIGEKAPQEEEIGEEVGEAPQEEVGEEVLQEEVGEEIGEAPQEEYEVISRKFFVGDYHLVVWTDEQLRFRVFQRLNGAITLVAIVNIDYADIDIALPKLKECLTSHNWDLFPGAKQEVE